MIGYYAIAAATVVVILSTPWAVSHSILWWAERAERPAPLPRAKVVNR